MSTSRTAPNRAAAVASHSQTPMGSACGSRRPSGAARLITWAAGAGLAALMLAHPAQARTDVGVSVQISQPGVYGRIDIGRFPQPQVIVAQPVVVKKPPRQRLSHQPVEPVYLWVPPGHRKNWSRHCSAYGACHVPVYFVRHDWYDRHVNPQRGGRPGAGPHRGAAPVAHRGGPPPHAQRGQGPRHRP